MLRIFTPVKIQRLRQGLNTQNWVPEASMLTTRPPKPSTLYGIFHKQYTKQILFNAVYLPSTGNVLYLKGGRLENAKQ